MFITDRCGASIISNTNNPPLSFETFTSRYGVDVLISPNPDIAGSLGSTDFIFNNRFLDLAQVEVATESAVITSLNSSTFDTSLLLVDVVNNELGNLVLQNAEQRQWHEFSTRDHTFTGHLLPRRN